MKLRPSVIISEKFSVLPMLWCNIPDQWTFLKAQLYQEVKFESRTWMEVNRWHRHACPDVLSLFDLILSIPASTAECERGFSTMKQVKIQTVILSI